MQPTSDESPQTDTGRWPAQTDTGRWPQPQTGFFAAPQPVATVTKARPWLTGVIAFLTLLVIIAAACNQWVVDAVARHTNGDTAGNHVAQSVYVYQWRFSPLHGDPGRLWVANLAAVGTVLLLTLLLVPVIVRGYGRFWQGLFGVWFTVVVATLLGGYARAAVVDYGPFGASSRGEANNVLYGTLSPNSQAIIAGVAVGFVVALIAAVTVVASRRDESLAADGPAPEPLTGPWRQDDAEQARSAAPGYPAAYPAQAPAPPPTVTPSPWAAPGQPPAGDPATPAGSPHNTEVLPSVDPASTPSGPSETSGYQPPTSGTSDYQSGASETSRYQPSSSETSDEAAAGPTDEPAGDVESQQAPTDDPRHADATTEFPRHSANPPDEQH